MRELVDDSTGEHGELADLSVSEHHELLADQRRRVTLDVLTDRTAPVEIEDLATAIAEREADDGVDETVVDHMLLRLHHVHLPKLAQFDVIDYDPEANRVESCPRRPDT